MFKWLFLMLSLLFLINLSACTNENKITDAIKIAKEQMGINEVLVASVGSQDSEIKREDTRRFCYYVLGLNSDNEEIFVVVPALKSQAAYLVNWPFNKTFTKIVADLNASSEGDILIKDDYHQVALIDSIAIMRQYDSSLEVEKLDFKLMIVYRGYTITQANKAIVIKGKGFS